MRNFFTHPSIAYPIVHASADYLRPIYCGDKLIINLIPKKITEDKFDINYEISVNNVIVAKAITRHVCIDVATRNKRQMSGEIISWLETNRRDVEDIERKKSREEII
jgi:1,4-dihydroxy-2-naphthoyl-CoA hydrolase